MGNFFDQVPDKNVFSNGKGTFCKAKWVHRNVGNIWLILHLVIKKWQVFFVQPASVISAFTKKIHFVPMHNDFYYTRSKHTCLHLHNVLLYFEKNILVNMHFSFGQHTICSMGMPPLFSLNDRKNLVLIKVFKWSSRYLEEIFVKIPWECTLQK